MRIYFYKLTVDAGAAPCVQRGLLSLAICKPTIRITAKVDDWIFGFAATSLHRDHRLIYVAHVTDKVSNGDYYREAQFAGRRDCIYRWRQGRFEWRPGSLYHGPADLIHDLGEAPTYERAHVLLSRDFRYFGRNGSSDYKAQFPMIRRAVETLGRGHRVRHPDRLEREMLALQRAIWNAGKSRVLGDPTTGPRRGVCHRGRSCGVLDLA